MTDIEKAVPNRDGSFDEKKFKPASGRGELSATKFKDQKKRQKQRAKEGVSTTQLDEKRAAREEKQKELDAPGRDKANIGAQSRASDQESVDETRGAQDYATLEAEYDKYVKSAFKRANNRAVVDVALRSSDIHELAQLYIGLNNELSEAKRRGLSASEVSEIEARRSSTLGSLEAAVKKKYPEDYSVTYRELTETPDKLMRFSPAPARRRMDANPELYKEMFSSAFNKVGGYDNVYAREHKTDNYAYPSKSQQDWTHIKAQAIHDAMVIQDLVKRNRVVEGSPEFQQLADEFDAKFKALCDEYNATYDPWKPKAFPALNMDVVNDLVGGRKSTKINADTADRIQAEYGEDEQDFANRQRLKSVIESLSPSRVDAAGYEGQSPADVVVEMYRHADPESKQYIMDYFGGDANIEEFRQQVAQNHGDAVKAFEELMGKRGEAFDRYKAKLAAGEDMPADRAQDTRRFTFGAQEHITDVNDEIHHNTVSPGEAKAFQVASETLSGHPSTRGRGMGVINRPTDADGGNADLGRRTGDGKPQGGEEGDSGRGRPRSKILGDPYRDPTIQHLREDVYNKLTVGKPPVEVGDSKSDDEKHRMAIRSGEQYDTKPASISSPLGSNAGKKAEKPKEEKPDPKPKGKKVNKSTGVNNMTEKTDSEVASFRDMLTKARIEKDEERGLPGGMGSGMAMANSGVYRDMWRTVTLGEDRDVPIPDGYPKKADVKMR